MSVSLAYQDNLCYLYHYPKFQKDICTINTPMQNHNKDMYLTIASLRNIPKHICSLKNNLFVWNKEINITTMV